MEYFDYIKEGVFEPQSIHIRSQFKDFSADKIRDCLAYCLYVEKDNNFDSIVCLLTSGEFDLDLKETFVNYLKMYGPQNFNETLFLLDTYTALFIGNMPKNMDSFMINREHKSDAPIYEILESFLAESRGLLLWTYQMEKICGLIHINIEDRINLRKDLNAKRVTAWKKFKDFNLDEARTLKDFAEERMIFGYTKWPNVQGGQRYCMN